ncbi:Infection structure specific protein [Colletotrichum higginsianum IMI 349063]|uniref:Infection structure specific protein n=2 Tax=Colletotrichum higginsianum TaxID=80884 RepID=A0A1B7XXJ6_COLHI|nr:Infection structure specific protein [Colletotrichum higginsianum IMI 349063]OBR04488.1 Infection structure specific protein [Colletotrichum higginsianum IMI 349063]TIC89597.1 hypothetical protein CH35J_012613 [Colletotrichum higginsianum]
MRVTTAVFGALAATVVAADEIRFNNIHKRIEPTKIIQVLEARGTPECTSAIYAFVDAVTGSDPLPTPPLELENWAATADLASSAADPCETLSVTGSIAPVYTSWYSSMESWRAAHMSEMRDVWHECTDIPLVSAEVQSILQSGGLCSSKLAELTSEGSGTAAATGTTGAGAGAATATPNFAPRETGMAFAAAAAAGFVFAAMQ